MDTDAASLFVFVVPGFVVPTVLLVLAFRSPSAAQVRRWASTSGVAMTATNEALVRAHLGRVRRYRSVAAFPFWWMATAPTVVGTRFPMWLATPAVGVLAYLAGALVAELTVRTDAAGPLKQASFAPRTVGDYRPGWLRNLAWLFLAVAGALSLAPAGTDESRTAAIALWTGLAVMAELAATRIVRRPQRSGDTDVLAADDALRATAVSMTVGITVLAGVAALSSAVQAVAPLESGPWTALSLAVSAIGQVMAVGVLSAIIRQETLGYRRRHRQAIGAGAA